MNKANILLVDDEVVFTTGMSKLLENRGYRVTAVNSGDNAIKCLKEENFDVMVLDLKMPGMDGITTLKEIKKLGLFTETLLLTGHGSLGTALLAVRMGAYDYLTKPCEIDVLVFKIESALEKKEEEGKIRKVVESLRSSFSEFPRKKPKK